MERPLTVSHSHCWRHKMLVLRTNNCWQSTDLHCIYACGGQNIHSAWILGCVLVRSKSLNCNPLWRRCVYWLFPLVWVYTSSPKGFKQNKHRGLGAKWRCIYRSSIHPLAFQQFLAGGSSVFVEPSQRVVADIFFTACWLFISGGRDLYVCFIFNLLLLVWLCECALW